MKVGIDISQIVYPGTGVGTYTRELVTAMLKQGSVDLKLFGVSLRKQNILREFNSQTKIFPIPPTILDILWNRLHIFPVENLIGPIDIFHSSDWTEPPARKAKKVTTIHDLVVYVHPQFSHPKIVATAKRKLEWVKKETNIIICDSQSTKVDVQKYLGIEENRLRVVYPGLPAGILRYKKQKYSGRPYILALGTREPRKNLEKLVAAFKSLTLKDYDLVIAGKYGWGLDISASNIKVLGYVTEEKKYELYANASLFCYPSLYEGFGFPILEAMAVGCPVLTSRRGSLEEVGGEASVYVDPNSVDDIAGEIDYCLNHDMYPRILAGREQVKKFTWEKTAQQTIEVYKEVCGY